MADVGFIFTAHSVRQTLAGRKWETRRVIKHENAPDPGHTWRECLCREIDASDTPCDVCLARFGKPRAFPGDTIWFKETWYYDGGDTRSLKPEERDPRLLVYRAKHDCRNWEGGCPCHDENGRSCWRSPMLMPRWASRVHRKVLRVRAEPLRAITERGAIAEGTPAVYAEEDGTKLRSAVEEYARLWDELHGKERPWAQCAGMFVWVYRYERKEGR